MSGSVPPPIPPGTDFTPGTPKVGVQLIIYGKRAREDFPVVLQEVKATGYDGVETGNLYSRYTPDEVKQLLNSNGLLISGCHVGYGELENPESVESAIEFLKGVNSRYLMVSGVGSREDGIEAYTKASRVFNEVGQKCRENGVYLCYHNHAWEFELIDGVTPMYYLIENTDPELVKLCIDVYWVQIGGDDPAKFISKFQSRANYFHFKDGRKGEFTELGRGLIDFDPVMPEVMNVAPEWVVYEQDKTDLEPRESLDISRRFMKERLNL